MKEKKELETFAVFKKKYVILPPIDANIWIKDINLSDYLNGKEGINKVLAERMHSMN